MRTLFVVPTPIGNLKDITLRALDVLKDVDVIASEDTRRTIKLLNHYNIKTKLVSYHVRSGKKKEGYFLDLLKEGKNVALVSDAGTPGIADPGYFIIKKVIEEKLNLVVLPGATSVITGLGYSGLKSDSFVFAGWMPRKSTHRQKIVDKYISLDMPIVFLESPHRINKTCGDIFNYFPEIHVVLARELTKIHEEIFRGNIKDCVEFVNSKKIKGEIVIILK